MHYNDQKKDAVIKFLFLVIIWVSGKNEDDICLYGFVNQARLKLYCAGRRGVKWSRKSGLPKRQVCVSECCYSCGGQHCKEQLCASCPRKLDYKSAWGREGRPARGCKLQHLPGALPPAKAGLQHLRSFGSCPRGILEFLSMRCMQREISGSTWNYLFCVFCYVSTCFWGFLCLFLVLGAPV